MSMENPKNDPSANSKTAEFLLSYSWKGKSKEQIIQEMFLPDYEQIYVEAGMKELSLQGKFTGMDLDRFIVHQLDMEDEDIGPIHDPDIVYLER